MISETRLSHGHGRVRCVEIAKGRMRSFVIQVRGQNHRLRLGDEPGAVPLGMYSSRTEGQSLEQNHYHEINVG